MPKIDAHQHFWVFDPLRDQWITEDMARIRRNFLPGDLAPLLKENKIDGCIAVQADQSLEETAFLLALAQKNSFIKGVVGWVDLKSQVLEKQLAQFAEQPLLKGFRHILQGENDLVAYLADGVFEKGVRTVLDRGYTYDLLVYHHQLPGILDMVDRLCQKNNRKIVLDHIGKPDLKTGQLRLWEKHIRQLAENQNLCCKLSGLVTEADWQHWKPDDLKAALMTVLEAFGPARLLFGSDWPVCLVATDYAKWLETLNAFFAPLTLAEKQAIFGDNAVRFYGIDI